MPDQITFSDLFRIARDEVLSRNARISREAVEREGMDANILIAAATALADEVVGQISDLSAALFIGSARGDVLDRLVFDRYGLTRKPAAASFGSIQFSTTAPSLTTFTIPDGTLVQTSDGVQFVTIESTVFVVGSTGPLTVAVRSSLAGASQNVKIGTITSIVSTISGAPDDLEIYNPYATAGGDDVETDESLRNRAQRYFITARRGTMAALEEAALSVPGIRAATAFEMLDSLGRPVRFVQLIVADSFTEQFADYSTTPPRYATQSQMITTEVETAISDVRPAGIYVQILTANVILQQVQLALAFTAGSDVNLAALQARAAVVNYTNSLSPGRTWSAQDVLAQIRLITGIAYTGNELVSPAGDVIAKPLQVIRTSLSLVSAVSSQTDKPLITGINPDAYSLAG